MIASLRRGRHRDGLAFRTDDERPTAGSTPPARPILTGTARRRGLVGGASGHVEAVVDAVFREEWGRIVASLIATTGDWDLAEECAQDAFARALQVWVRDGVPSRPGAWLTTVARNRAVDVLRRRANETVKLQQALLLSPAEEPAEEPAEKQAEEEAEEP